MKCGIFTDKHPKHKTKYLLLYAYDNEQHTSASVIAQLRVSESEFWQRLGKALNIKFVREI